MMLVRRDENEPPFFLGMGSTFYIDGKEGQSHVELILPEDTIRQLENQQQPRPGLGFKYATKAWKVPTDH